MVQSDASATGVTADSFRAPLLPVRALNAVGRAALQPAKLLLQKTHGFLFLPVLAQSEVASAAALQFLTDSDTRVPFQVAWPVSYLPFDTEKRSVEQIKTALDADRETLLQNLDFAIARQQTNALLILDSTPSDRHRLLEHCAPFINLRREALRAGGLRFIWLWPSAMAQALMSATPDLWSMRALAPLVGAESLQASTLETVDSRDPSGGNFVSKFPPSLTRVQSAQWAAWQQHRNLRLAGLSVEDALALISVLEATSQWTAERDLCEAVLSQLAVTPRPAANLLPGAQALSGLSLALSKLGDLLAALRAIRRAVEIYEELAQDNFAAYGAVLASSLNNLSVNLAETGERAAALVAIRRAVEIYEKLAQDNFATYGAVLAISLNNLSNFLADTGEPAAGLVAIRRAVEIREKLAQVNFAAHGAALASSLNNLSNHLGASGEPAAGLVAIRHAVEIYEKLAQDNFAAYGADLASSLNNLSVDLAESGEPAACLVAICRAVEIREKLAQDNFAAYGAALASSLNNLSNCLGASGEPAAGLAAIRRAVEIYEKLAQGNFAAYGAVLASSLNNLSNLLADTGEPAAGLVAIRHAVEIREKLAQDNFAAYGADLASSLHNLSNLLAEAGEPAELAEARQANTRALQLIEPFALPNTEYAQWQVAMQNQRDRLAQLGGQPATGL